MTALRRAAATLVVAIGIAACHHENPRVPPPPFLAVSSSVLVTTESGGDASFDVVLLDRPSAPVEVEVRSGDATEGLVLAPGYTLPGAVQELAFTPDDWDVPRRVVVHAIDDDVDDGDVAYDVAVRVTYSEDARYASAPPASVRVTNSDDDVPGVIVSTPALVTSEGGSARILSVRLGSMPSSWASVEISSGDVLEGLVSDSADGCPWAGSTHWQWFDAFDWNVPHELALCPQDDPDADGDRVYVLTVSADPSSAPEYALLPHQTVTVTNADDETGFSVLAPAARLVTSERGTTATFTVRLNAPPVADVVIPVTSSNPGEGLVASGTAGPRERIDLVFTPASWNTPRTVTVVGQDYPGVPVALDDVSFTVSVGPSQSTDPAHAGRVARAVEVLNRDDDVAPALVVSPSAPLVTNESGARATFLIALSRPPLTEVTVPVETGDSSEGLLRADRLPGPGAYGVAVSFSPLDWAMPRFVTVIGQPDLDPDGAQTYAIRVGPPQGDAEYAALAERTVTVRNEDVSFAATYDGALGAPSCREAWFGCTSGELLVGRGPFGPEPNAPNTIGSACPDGSDAASSGPRSVDRIHVSTTDGSPLAAGKSVFIEVFVTGHSYPYDRFDLFHAADATAPVWHAIVRDIPGEGEFMEWFTLPAGVLQALRAQWRYSGVGGGWSPCEGTGSVDRDDLVFAVSP